LGIDLVVSVDLDGQLARADAFARRGHPQVGAALVDDPLAVGADPRLADAIVLVERQGLRLGLPGQVVAQDVGGRPPTFAHVVKEAAVRAPHGRVVLPVELGDLLIATAVGVANPDVIIGGAAIPLAVPGAGPADVSELIALGREDAFAPFAAAHAADAAAFD